MYNKHKGLGFFEILLTLAIISIIASAVAPTIRERMVTKQIHHALQGLTAAQVAMEQQYMKNGRYGTNNHCLVKMPSSKVFQFECQLRAKGRGYEIIANSTGFRGIKGLRYAINDRGEHRTEAFPKAKVPVNCWLTSKTACQA